MKAVWFGVVSALLLFNCGGGGEIDKAKALAAEGKVIDAKNLYEAHLAKDPNPNVEREFIQFLFDNKFYVDFNTRAKNFLARFPQDTVTKNLMFEYYSRLAKDAERLGNYQTAMELIAAHLLSPDYSEWRKWESRQPTILKKWYEAAAEKGVESDMKKVLVQIRALGYDNLAQTLNAELFAQIEAEANRSEIPAQEQQP
ncbi:MAG: hypothetical protein KDC71_19240 [Acidobacteria bacterium]|nr:hypothetical protein [Acidobacteriota bacterium]